MSSLPAQNWRSRLANEIEPALQAQGLRKELRARKVGLVLVVATLLVQAFAVFNPPEQTFASTSGDIIPGGATSINQLVKLYDANPGNNSLRDITRYLGLSRDDLAKLSNPQVMCTKKDAGTVRISRQHLFSSNEGETTYSVPTDRGTFATFYSIPTSLLGAKVCYKGFNGKSSRLGAFTIVSENGDIQFKQSSSAPYAHFTSGSCRSIQGYALDPRQFDQNVKVYIFVGGKPGVGKAFGPILANKNVPGAPQGHGFTFYLPDNKEDAGVVSVWGAIQPLKGWVGPMVQFDGTLTINKGCTQPPAPTATCENLEVNMITHNQIRLKVSAQAQQGATVQGYHIIITSAAGKRIIDKKFTANALNYVSDNETLQDVGQYSAKASVLTTVGERTSSGCMDNFHITQADTCQYNPVLTAADARCRVCPYNSGIWIDSLDCTSKTVLSMSVDNLTANINDVNDASANIGDRLQYALFTTNLGSDTAKVPLIDDIGGVINYTTIIDNNGTVDNDAKTINWGETTIEPNQTNVRKLIVQVNSIPATPSGANDPVAFSCSLVNSYGNTSRIGLDCSVLRRLSNVLNNLPSVGIEGNIIFGFLLLVLSSYLYMRARLLTKELRLIKEMSLGKNIFTASARRSVLTEISGLEQSFSNLIHRPAVEGLTRALAMSLARSNAIILGCTTAFLGVLALYSIGHTTGTSLSGFETIGSFAIGWMSGVIFDLAKAIVKAF